MFLLSEMAAKGSHDYWLVDNDVDLKKALAELKGKLERNTRLAVDCEGVSLSRKGELTVIVVATEEKAYIFDVVKLGRAVFTEGLGEILEDKSREKLTFDCREDSDALWHQFNVKLAGVLDLQLLEILYRRNVGRFVSSWGIHPGQRTGALVNVNGFRRCIEHYLRDADLIRKKDKGVLAIKLDQEVWKKRPLSDDLLHYATVDAVSMFPLYNKLKSGAMNEDEQARLRVASERYLDFLRGKCERTYDRYEKNAYLPLYVIPAKGSLDFSELNSDSACARCKRKFPHDEFTGGHLREGQQTCRVCKKIEYERRYRCLFKLFIA